MWECELCHKKLRDKVMAIELKFGYVDSKEAKEKGNQYDTFYPEEGIGPVCDDCAIDYIKGEK